MIEFIAAVLILPLVIILVLWHHLRIGALESDMNTLGRVIATYYDAERLCELTKDMVLEADKKRIKTRPAPSHLTVIKGPRQ